MTVDLKAWADKIETDMFVDTEECRELIEEIKRLRKEKEALKIQVENTNFVSTKDLDKLIGK